MVTYCLAQSHHQQAGGRGCHSVSLCLCSCSLLAEFITNSWCYVRLHRTGVQPISEEIGRIQGCPGWLTVVNIKWSSWIIWSSARTLMAAPRADCGGFRPLLHFSSHSVFFCLLAYSAIQAVSVYSLRNSHVCIPREVCIMLTSNLIALYSSLAMYSGPDWAVGWLMLSQ